MEVGLSVPPVNDKTEEELALKKKMQFNQTIPFYRSLLCLNMFEHKQCLVLQREENKWEYMDQLSHS